MSSQRQLLLHSYSPKTPRAQTEADFCQLHYIMMRTEPLASPVRDSSGDSIINELGTELQELYVNLGENRSRKLLLETLNNEGLATRDIFSFVVKQAQQKVLTRDIDQATSE